MEDTRNFRLVFYEKMNIRSVEENRSLDILLKESPVDVNRLRNFLRLFSVPNLWRSVLYNLTLDVHPIHKESKEFVMEHRTEMFNDLKRALELIRYIDDKTPKNKIFYAMYLLETRQLANPTVIHKDSPFPLIADVILQSLEVNEIEAYFISRNFYKLSEEISKDLSKLKQLTFQVLEKEDCDLFENLKSKNILEELPFNRWYPTIFSSILNENSLIRIFDRIAGGSYQIVAFIFIAICSCTRYNLKNQINATNATKFIENYPIDHSDDIVNKTIKLYHEYFIAKNAK